MSAPHSDVILDRMMSLHPKYIDLTLDRMWRLLVAMDHPERSLPPVVHVAGTNGKGSTMAMIRAGLEGVGEICHAYTSPHLARFHERIRVASEIIEEDALCDVLEECWAANDGEAITYFEITTVAGLTAFSRTAADWTLLEVGLGGRLDATNVIERPRLCVITPIDYDHQQFLGETITEIAGEKAGILKPGVPCVVSAQRPEARDVIEAQAERVGAPLLSHGQDWQVYEERGRLVYQDERGLLDLPLPNLPGPHQLPNAGAAIAALRFLDKPEAACEAAVTKAYWPARMQKLVKGPLIDAAPEGEIWLDGGHNPAAGRALADTIKTLPKRSTYLIAGMLNTKDVEGFMRPLAEIADGLEAVSIPGEAATLPAEDTAKAGRNAGIPTHVSESVDKALARILADCPQARVVICGSLYLAGWILREHA